MRRVILAVLLSVASVGIVSTASAATITVAAGEVAVDAGNGNCSLREAINNAELILGGDTSGGDCVAGDPGADTIVLAAASTYDLPDIAVSDGANGDSGLPAITSVITIQGNGAIIQRSPTLFSGTPCGGGGDKFRIFFIYDSGNLTLENVRLRNGCASGSAGGAIFNCGALTITDSVIDNNVADTSAGAIQNDGMLTLTRSTLSNNAVTSGAGGAVVDTGGFEILQSTINNNSTPGAGGALLEAGGGGTRTIANSTISGNSADGTGGGLQNDASTSLTNVTVAFNQMGPPGSLGGPGAGIFGSSTLANTLLADQIGGSDCAGVTSLVGNLDDDGSCAATTTTTPDIGPLANNGGPTQTHALLAGSPAIDTGDNATCAAAPVDNFDQRGFTRPIFGRISVTCDVGAYEFRASSTAPTLSPVALVLLVLALGAIALVTMRHNPAG